MTPEQLKADIASGRPDRCLAYVAGASETEQRKLAKVVAAPRPEGAGSKWVNVNLYEQVLTAYQGDNLVFATLISGRRG